MNITLPGVIAAAYPSKTRDLVGAPDWLSRERFDLAARAAFQPSPREREQMLQKLLADRFKLVAHYRSEERAVYRLERVRPGGALGPQLRALSFECDMFKPVGQVPDRLTYGEPPCAIQMRTGGEKVSVVSGGRTMDGLGDTLGGIVGRPVIDRTVLPGYYEFSLEFPAEQTGAPLFTAIKEQLGLKLESAREAVDVLVIDHIERPTEK